jgi:hypothetical protein
MKMTVLQLYDAVNALVSISNQPRMIPTMAKYKLARMHDALEPTYNIYEKQRIELVRQHGSEQFADPEKTKSLGFGVQPGTPGFDAYVKEWTAVCQQEVDINVKPITLQMLGDDPKGVELSEFKQLGDLVVDTTASE